MEWKQDNFTVSDDKSQLDVEAIYQFLTTSYWAKGRSRETVEQSIANSFCLGLFEDRRQIGFCRVITDFCTFAYLLDVYVLDSYRNRRLGHFFLKTLFTHPKVTGVKWILKTSYSQSLYSDFGFKEIDSGAGWMVRERGQM